MSARRIPVLIALLAVVGVGLAVFSSSASAVQDARAEALASAKSRIPTLLSYQHADLQADLAAATATTTGDFRKEYRKLLAEVVGPTAAQKKVDTVADVTSVGVVEATTDRVVVLAFVTQTTVAQGVAPAVTGSRVEVTLVPMGDEWLISGLEPV